MQASGFAEEPPTLSVITSYLKIYWEPCVRFKFWTFLSRPLHNNVRLIFLIFIWNSTPVLHIELEQILRPEGELHRSDICEIWRQKIKINYLLGVVLGVTVVIASAPNFCTHAIIIQV